jgi:exonuclease VII large subunit
VNSAAAPQVAGVSAFAAPTVATPVAAARASTPSAGATIIVNGAVDPEATARQIQRILTGHGRRIGLRVA